MSLENSTNCHFSINPIQILENFFSFSGILLVPDNLKYFYYLIKIHACLNKNTNPTGLVLITCKVQRIVIRIVSFYLRSVIKYLLIIHHCFCHFSLFNRFEFDKGLSDFRFLKNQDLIFLKKNKIQMKSIFTFLISPY